MSISEIKGSTVTAKLWLPLEDVEEEAKKQIANVASLPWTAFVSVMPDCHVGKGVTIGSVIAMEGAISPVAVGSDIGCGVLAVQTSLVASDLPDNLGQIQNKIEKFIPTGFESRQSVSKYAEKSRLWKEFQDLDPKVLDQLGRVRKQMGTLGNGNHFIEVCLDASQRVWLHLHSGSRNIGKVLSDIHAGRARKQPHNINLSDPDLCPYLSGTPEMEAFLRDLNWAQRYAWENREVMLSTLKEIFTNMFSKVKFADEIHCHHNYVTEEEHFGKTVFVTRKGAISARAGELGIIPGSMATPSYIVRGLGNADSLNSAPHGAGRCMSRTQARRQFTRADLEEQTKGVVCYKGREVIDEIPSAYKDIAVVVKNSETLIEVVTELKQIICVKGHK